MTATAVFLDRDGTIIEDSGYVKDPNEVRLIPGAADAVRRFSEAGHLVVIVSNQSGVARGLFTEEDLSRVHDRFVALLEAEGAKLDGAYYCPYLDGAEAEVEAYRRKSGLRKPQPGMLLQAADEMDIDLARSWMIGDAPRDVEAGARAKCRTILIAPRRLDEHDTVTPTHTVKTIQEAAEVVEHEMRQRDEANATSPIGQDKRAVKLLEDIRDRLDRAQREKRQQDFSFMRLLGALVQMFAIVAALWGVAALMSDGASTATARFLLAIFLQLASIFAFAVDRFR
ncbi:MAG: HAD family hydrolase [Phycisphaerae bacterium]|jgi:D-glycero-D-manno-heptose 1,7-bisphosphate phosphatase